MKSSDFFPDLNLHKFEAFANSYWIYEWPNIDKITLFRGKQQSFKYGIVAESHHPDGFKNIARSIRDDDLVKPDYLARYRLKLIMLRNERLASESFDPDDFLSIVNYPDVKDYLQLKKNIAQGKIKIDWKWVNVNLLKYAYEHFNFDWNIRRPAKPKNDIEEDGVYKTGLENRFYDDIWRFFGITVGDVLPDDVIPHMNFELYRRISANNKKEDDFCNDKIVGSSENDAIPLKTVKSELDQIAFDDAIKGITFYYVNDSEVRVKDSSKTVPFTYASFGYKTKEIPAWKEFIHVIEEPPHIFRAGIHTQNKPYYKKRTAMLSRINAKLILFFNKEYPLQIPEKHKLYVRCPDEEPGSFRFKFKVSIDDTTEAGLEKRYRFMAENRLMDEFDKVCNAFKAMKGNEEAKIKVSIAAKVLMDRNIMTRQEIANYLHDEKEESLPDLNDLTIK